MSATWARSNGFPSDIAESPSKIVTIVGLMRPSVVGPRLDCGAKLFTRLGLSPPLLSGLYAPPTATTSFAVAGVPIVPALLPAFPAAKRIVMSGWAQTNASTIRAWTSYTFVSAPQLSLWIRTGAVGSLYTSPAGPNRSS